MIGNKLINRINEDEDDGNKLINCINEDEDDGYVPGRQRQEVNRFNVSNVKIDEIILLCSFK